MIFTLGFFSLSLAVGSTVGSLIELKKNRETISGDQSFYTAEAAVREGIYQYVQEYTYSPDVSLNNSDGLFTVIPDWPYVEVEGSAENYLTNRTVKNTLLLFPAGAAFDYAVYSENDLTIKGGSNNIIIGDIFSNANIDCSGNPNIQGNSFANGSISNNCGEEDSINEGEDIIEPPNINPDYYEEIATCISTPDNAMADCLSEPPTEGVVFIEDTENPESETSLQNIDVVGNLTVIGDLSLTGGCSVSTTDDYIALVVDGDLKISGDNTIKGIVYVSGNTSFGHGNTTIIGSLISVEGAETDISGSVTIDYRSPSGPPGGILISGNMEIVSWQEE